jgi:hypothetical protein
MASTIGTEALVVDVALRDERGAELILQDAGRDFHDGAVMVGRSGGEGFPADRLLQIHETVFGVEVGRLRHGGVGFALADRLEFLRDAVVADDHDMTLFTDRMQEALALQGL